MANALTNHAANKISSLQAQMGDTFLSFKHQDYLAALAELSSAVRA